MLKKEKTEQNNNPIITVYDVNLSLIKILVVIAVTTLSSFLVGHFIANPHPLFSVIAIVSFLAFFILQTLFLKEWKKIVLAISLESIAMVLPILMAIKFSISFHLIIAWVILALFIILAKFMGRVTVKNSIKIPFLGVAKIVVVQLVMGIVIFMTLIYVFIPAPADSPLDDASRTIAEATVLPLVKLFIPEFTLDTTTGELIEITARDAVDKHEVSEGITQGERAALTSSVEEEYAEFIRQYIGEFNPESTPTTIIANVLGDSISKPESLGMLYFNIILFLAALFLLRGIAFAVYIPTAIITFLIYETLIVFKFVSVEYESRSREILILK